MATFTFGRTVDIHWNGFEVVGPAGTVFSIPDQLYEEFNDDILPVEPTLVWIDTNEFLTLSNSVSVSQLQGTFPISVTTTTSGKNVAISSSTNPAGYTMVADGTGGVIFQAASTGALTSVVGVSPMSTIVSGNTASVILNASYQTAGTYVTSVVGTSPISATGTTAITVTIDQTALTAGAATTSEALRTYVKNSSGSTITKGQVVYITGADGTNALIGLASASADPTSSKTLGIAANTMTNNAFGYVIENGQLSNIDTSAATAGSSVWLGATPGSLVFNTPPAEPDHAVYLGVVNKANPSTGEILVKVQNGYELDELHDVFVGGVSTALPLVYNSTSSGWVAQALTSVGIADNAVVAAKIDAGAVTSAKIAAGAVGSASLADNAVVAAKISAAAVGTVAISSGSATSGQILQANGSGGVSFATLAAAAISVNNITADYTLALTDAGNIVASTNTATELVITIPLNSSVAFSNGTIVRIAQPTGKQVRVTASTGVVAPWTSTLYKYTPSQGSYIEIAKYTTDTWIQQGLQSYGSPAGYIYAGENSATTVTTINKWSYSTETNSTLSATSLTKAEAIGVTNPGVAGYVYGGAATSIGKFTYSTEAASTLSSSAGVSLGGVLGTGFESANAGYVTGGNAGGRLTARRKVLYSTDTPSTLSPGLSSFVEYVIHHSNYNTFGISFRGSGSSVVDTVDKTTYSNDTLSAMDSFSGSGTINNRGAGAGNTGKAGYVFGGLSHNGTRLSAILKMTYSGTAHSSLSETLSYGVYLHFAMNNPGTCAYVYIADADASLGNNTMNKFDYSTDTRSITANALGFQRKSAAAMSNWG